MRFKCERRRNLHPVDSIQASVALATREMKEKLLASGFMDYRAHLYAGFHPHIPTASRLSTESLHSGGTMPSPASSSGSASLSSPGKLSPGSDHKGSRSRSPPSSSPGNRSPGEEKRKRSLEADDEYSSVKRLATEESRKPETFSPREGSQSPEAVVIHRHHNPPPSGVKSEKLRIDMNQNVNSPSDDEENVSAFRKVEKQHPSIVSPQSEQQQQEPFDLTSTTSGATLYNPAMRGPAKEAMFAKSLGMEGAMMPRYPLLPPGSFPPAFLASSGLSENISANLAELYRHPSKLASVGRPMAKLGDINNIENNIAGKLPAYFGAETRGTGAVPMSFGYYKSANPMVDKILSSNPTPTPVVPTFSALGTNWCAKCNASFRMTSDLVYHMRSHHKTNYDPLKKKREDKLKCNICGETFRERHHLTRHMTSHA